MRRDAPIPVSYTHLDVYKRQGYEMLGGKLTKKAVVISAVIMILMTYFADRVDLSLIHISEPVNICLVHNC